MTHPHDDRGMSVDVIVPAFNRVEWLAECLDSVIEQSYPNFRLIVVDDGSVPPLSDRPALAAIFRDGRVRLIRSANNGPAAARNLGLMAADGAFVLMLDSDDILEPTGLEALVGAARAAGTDAAVGGWADFDTATSPWHVVLPEHGPRDAYANCVEYLWIIGAALLRNIGIPRFNERRMPWEALEFYLDYFAEGRTVAHVDRVVVGSRQHREPDRLTIRHDHFEPHNTGRFFAEKKDQLKRAGLATGERIAALDGRILSCIHSLLRQGCRREARQLFDAVSWDLIGSERRQRFGSFAWSSRVFGFAGARAFIAANRVLGRV
jgi:glycosyltransferase involved in cell wall biosynthesis